MNVRLAFWIICAILVFGVAVVLFRSTGIFSTQDSEIVDILTSNVWIGTSIDMPGLFSSTREEFGDVLKLTLQRNHKCLLELPGKTFSARWTLKEEEIHIRGRGLDTKGHFDHGIPSVPEFSPTISLYDIENYMVTFYREADL